MTEAQLLITGATGGTGRSATQALIKQGAMRSQVHEGCVAACAMKRRLGPIFNAANDAVEQALSKTSLAELVRDIG
jgi:NADP-dependent 3-hydroxy acid dehydrogenase YdfG